MPFAQLRALVVLLMEPEELALEEAELLNAELAEYENPSEHDEAVAEFESRPTTCMPRVNRASTLDTLIASLRASPPPIPFLRRRA